MNKRILFLITLLLPAAAGATDWVALGEIPEARVFLDKDSVQAVGDDIMARLKYSYNKTQPAQTISQGSPFDSSVNQYYLVCSAQRYQVLELNVFYNNKLVGSFHANPDPKERDPVKLGTGVMLLIKAVCPGKTPGAARPAGADGPRQAETSGR
jgi:Surface-adhesin protein E